MIRNKKIRFLKRSEPCPKFELRGHEVFKSCSKCGELRPRNTGYSKQGKKRNPTCKICVSDYYYSKKEAKIKVISPQINPKVCTKNK